MKALIALFAASLFTTAVADNNSKEDKAMRTSEAKFDKLDRDDDNRVSAAEAQQEERLTVRFASVDRNPDGFVSKSEYRAQLDTDERRSYREP